MTAFHCNWCGANDEPVSMAGWLLCGNCGRHGYLVTGAMSEGRAVPSDPISAVEERLEMEADHELMRDEFHVR